MKTLFERQDYPDLRTKTHLWQGIPRRVEVEGGPLRPYDVAGWTLPLQMGVEAVEVGEHAPGRDLRGRHSFRPLGSNRGSGPWRPGSWTQAMARPGER